MVSRSGNSNSVLSKTSFLHSSPASCLIPWLSCFHYDTGVLSSVTQFVGCLWITYFIHAGIVPSSFISNICVFPCLWASPTGCLEVHATNLWKTLHWPTCPQSHLILVHLKRFSSTLFLLLQHASGVPGNPAKRSFRAVVLEAGLRFCGLTSSPVSLRLCSMEVTLRNKGLVHSFLLVFSALCWLSPTHLDP